MWQDTVKTTIARMLQPGPTGTAGRRQGVQWVVGGMGTALVGQKLAGLSMFARGVVQLERVWREEHPEFEGGLRERVQASLAFYDQTHQHPTNRKLHAVGIPLILGGAVGLMAAPTFRPLWWGAAGAFAAGWALNIAGHVAFEKNAPAFSQDPLSFLVGPLWDAKKLLAKRRAGDAIVVPATA